MSASAQQQKIRRIVWTAAIASVTATGAWYGAGLKTKSELKQVVIFLLIHSSPPTLSFHPEIRSRVFADGTVIGSRETSRSHTCGEDRTA
jgi:hypothetical protein